MPPSFVHLLFPLILHSPFIHLSRRFPLCFKTLSLTLCKPNTIVIVQLRSFLDSLCLVAHLNYRTRSRMADAYSSSGARSIVNTVPHRSTRSMENAGPPLNFHSGARREDLSNDWRGPDDPDCPYNWPMWKRIYMTTIPLFLSVNVSVSPIYPTPRYILIYADHSPRRYTRQGPTPFPLNSTSRAPNLCSACRFSSGPSDLVLSLRLLSANIMGEGLYIKPPFRGLAYLHWEQASRTTSPHCSSVVSSLAFLEAQYSQ